MKKNNFYLTAFLLLLLFSTSDLRAQSFENVISEPDIIEGDVTIKTDREKNIYVGSSELVIRSGFNGRGIVYTKLDPYQNLVYRKYINPNLTSDENLRFFSMVYNDNNDRLYILGGLATPISNYPILFEIDGLTGNVINSTLYQSNSDEYAYGLNLLLLKSNTELIITGLLSVTEAISDENIYKKALLMKIGINGNIIWTKSYDSPTHNYLTISNKYFDYNKFTRTIEDPVKDFLYTIGRLNTYEDYYNTFYGRFITNFSSQKVLSKIDLSNGNLIWDVSSNSFINFPDNSFSGDLFISSILLDKDYIVTLENYTEFYNLAIHDKNGVLIKLLRLVNGPNSIYYNTGYNLLQDENYYYAVGYNNNTNNLVVFKIDKTNYSFEISEFQNYNSNFNIQDVNDYFSNYYNFNKSCYFQENSLLKSGYIQISSGLISGGFGHVKISTSLPFVCTNSNEIGTSYEDHHDEFQNLFATNESFNNLNFNFASDFVNANIEGCYSSNRSPDRSKNFDNNGSNLDFKSSFDEIEYFPNPANNKLIINILKSNSFKIFNTLGQEIKELDYQTNSNRIELNTTSLAEGMYFIEVNQIRYKFIISH